MFRNTLQKLTSHSTGGSSGIGYASACLFARKGAHVLILDLNPPDEGLPERTEYRHCNVAHWTEQRAGFAHFSRVDVVVANAGVSQEGDYLADTLDADGELQEPGYAVIDVNTRAVFNSVKLAVSIMRRCGVHGSIVLTASATGYAPEQNLPFYSATKAGVSVLSCSVN